MKQNTTRLLLLLVVCLLAYVAYMSLAERRETPSLENPTQKAPGNKQLLESNKIVQKLTKRIDDLTELHQEIEDARKKANEAEKLKDVFIPQTNVSQTNVSQTTAPPTPAPPTPAPQPATNITTTDISWLADDIAEELADPSLDFHFDEEDPASAAQTAVA